MKETDYLMLAMSQYMSVSRALAASLLVIFIKLSSHLTAVNSAV